MHAHAPAVEQQGTPAVHRGHADTSQLLVAGMLQRSEGPGIDDGVVDQVAVERGWCKETWWRCLAVFRRGM